MSDPRISLILPVFNDRAHLRPLLASLLDQSERSLEIIAVDDGSSDGSLGLLEAAARADQRLVVVSQDHCGVSAARNHGLGLAHGRWVAFADSDDWIDPRALQGWCDRAEAADADLLVGNAFRFYDAASAAPRQAILEYQPWDEVVSGGDWIRRAVAMREWPHYVWLQLARRAFLQRIGARFLQCMVNHSDIVWTLNLALAADRVAFCREPLYGYRVNPGSLSRNPSSAAARDRARSYLVAIDRLIARANEQGHAPALRRALTHQASVEAKSMLSVMRKRLPAGTPRRELAERFMEKGFLRVLFHDAVCLHDMLVAIRSALFLCLCRMAPGHPDAEPAAHSASRRSTEPDSRSLRA